MFLGLISLSWAMSKSVHTLKQTSGNVNQMVTSSALGWESYYGDPKQLKYAIQGATYASDTEVSCLIWASF